MMDEIGCVLTLILQVSCQERAMQFDNHGYQRSLSDLFTEVRHVVAHLDTA